MEINKKIEQILSEKNITSSQFADEVGVTRSGISHILNGRNRPSLDLVQKIIARYPELGTAWILDSEPLPTLNNRSLNNSTAAKHTVPDASSVAGTEKSDIKSNLVTSGLINQPVNSPLNNKQVERVMVFYTDGTFKEYSPT